MPRIIFIIVLDVNNNFILSQKNTILLAIGNDITLNSCNKKYVVKLTNGCDLGRKTCYDIGLIINTIQEK